MPLLFSTACCHFTLTKKIKAVDPDVTIQKVDKEQNSEKTVEQ